MVTNPRLVLSLQLVVIALFVCFVAELGAFSGTVFAQSHDEDFTAVTYRDSSNTTAFWDTAAAELRLAPYTPTLVKSYATAGQLNELAVSGDLAFLADYGNAFLILDVTDPSNPVQIGSSSPFSQYATAVVVSGDYAYVSEGVNSIRIYDISDPTNPTGLSLWNTSGVIRDLQISGHDLFVADASGALRVYDVTDPTTPTYKTGNFQIYDIHALAIDGNLTYVADGDSGLTVLRTNSVGTIFKLVSVVSPMRSRDVVVSGDHAYLATDYELIVHDVSDPTNPAVLATYTTPALLNRIAIDGNRLILSINQLGIQVLDISDPANPRLVGEYDTPGYTEELAIEGDLVYVADDSGGLQIVRIADIVLSPELTATHDTPGNANDVYVHGERVYVADVAGGLQIVDMSDPTNPLLAGSYSASLGEATDVFVAGDLAFIADRDSGLQIVDVTDPSTPVFVGAYQGLTQPEGVTVSGEYAYVADYGGGLRVIDITDPANPTLEGSLATTRAYGVDVTGDLAFVGDWSGGLRAIDISDPTTPSLVGTWATFGRVYGVRVAGDHAFIADGPFGLKVIDISDPTTMTSIGAVNPGSCYDVTLAGNYAFMAAGPSGLAVIDITDPTTPSYLDQYSASDYATGVARRGDFAIISDQTAGLKVVQVFRSDADTSGNVGQSLTVNASPDTILRARLTATETTGITWKVSSNGGASWTPIVEGGGWYDIATAGNDLRWRSKHTWSAGLNPTVFDLNLEWLTQSAAMAAIADVPNDQGGRLYVQFDRSGYDFADETQYPVVGYNIYRRVDNVMLTAAVGNGERVKGDKDLRAMSGKRAFVPAGARLRQVDGATYVTATPGGTFPPGTWALVESAYATQSDSYLFEVNSAADSSGSGTNWSVYVVTSHTTTPSVWFISNPDSGYSVDNIAPAAPQNFVVEYNTGSGNALSWDPAPEPDLQYYNVYRDVSTPNFTPHAGNLVASVPSPTWADPSYGTPVAFYKITAVDDADNESDPTSPGTLTSSPDVKTPETFALYQNVPNPFNPMTTIRIDVASGGGKVTLRIFDVGGQLVRTLVDAPMPAGGTSIQWNGRNDGGHRVASGTYFYRLTAPGFEKTRKMVLLK